MTTLHQALQATSWRLLKVIGRQRGLRFPSNIHKAALLNRLVQILPDPDNLRTTLATLSTSEQQALASLLRVQGRLPLRYLQPRYGQPHTRMALVKWMQADQPSLLPLERLLVLGLIFYDPATTDLFIPTDLIPLLPEPVSPPRPLFAQPVETPAPVDLVCHDLAYLLALLHRADIRLLHGRWLPSGFLATWGQHCAVPPISTRARSELQTGRRRFLHYLSVGSGQLSVISDQSSVVSRQSSADNRQPTTDHEQRTTGPRPPTPTPRPYLKPTPAAWLWLNASRAEQLQTLWQTWTKADPEHWQRFRLPGHDWLSAPVRLLPAIHAGLIEIDPSDPALFAQTLLTRQPDLLDLVPANLLDRAEQLTETVADIVRGPLVWLGVLQPDGQNSEPGRRGAEEQGRDLPSPPAPPPFGSPAQLLITWQGHTWLTGKSLPADNAPSYAKFSLETDLQPDPLDSTLTLSLRDGLPEPVDLATAIEVGSEDDPNPLLPAYSLTVTAASFINALHRGWSPPALLDALNRLAERPLSGQETALLRTWAEAANRMTLRQATILESTDPKVITRLASTRRGRDLIHRTLSTRAVVVDPARLDQLVRRLTEQESVPPKAESIHPSHLPGGFVLHPSPPDAAHLWLALQVYRGLDQHIRLPVRIPQSTVDHLTALLTPTDLVAADVAAEQTLAALRQALDGRTPFPPWPEGSLPEEESLALIEQALNTGQNLELHYYAASTDRLTRRIVEPYRLEWHGGQAAKRPDNRDKQQADLQNRKSGTPYLIGFCHLAQQERMFRLDRIQAIAMVEREV